MVLGALRWIDFGRGSLFTRPYRSAIRSILLFAWAAFTAVATSAAEAPKSTPTGPQTTPPAVEASTQTQSRFPCDQFEAGGYSQIPEFKRSNPRAQPFNGVGFGTHPRGKRIGFFDWDYPGLKTAVSIDGTLNDASDKDRGWTVELAFPWVGLKWLAKAEGKSLTPKDSDEPRKIHSPFI